MGTYGIAGTARRAGIGRGDRTGVAFRVIGPVELKGGRDAVRLHAAPRHG